MFTQKNNTAVATVPQSSAINQQLNRAAAVQEVDYGGTAIKGIDVFDAKGLTLDKDTFVLRFVSTTDTTTSVGMLVGAGYGDLPAGYAKPVDQNLPENGFIVGDGTGPSLYVESLSDVTVQQFMNWVNRGAVQITAIQIEAPNSQTQVRQSMSYSQYDPYKMAPDLPWRIDALRNQNVQQLNIVGPFSVPGECFISEDTALKYKVLPKVSTDTPNEVIVTFYLDNYMSMSKMTRIIAAKQRENA